MKVEDQVQLANVAKVAVQAFDEMVDLPVTGWPGGPMAFSLSQKRGESRNGGNPNFWILKWLVYSRKNSHDMFNYV